MAKQTIHGSHSWSEGLPMAAEFSVYDHDLAGPVVAGDHLQCDRKPNILVYGIDEHPMNAYISDIANLIIS